MSRNNKWKAERKLNQETCIASSSKSDNVNATTEILKGSFGAYIHSIEIKREKI